MKPRLQEIIARYDGYCAECRKPIVRNAKIVYDWQRKATLCKPCGEFKMKQAELFQ